MKRLTINSGWYSVAITLGMLMRFFCNGEDTFFESGDYITVMYNNENPFPTYQQYSSITSSFPHYDYWIDKNLRVLIFKINTTENKRRLLCVKS